MGKNTSIGWTHIPGYEPATWNPAAAYRKDNGKRGWHCVKHNKDCLNCYAESLNMRLGTGLPFSKSSGDKIEIRLVNLDLPTRTTKPTCWFSESMSDLFGEFMADDQIKTIIDVMINCPRHLFLNLTKRWDRQRDFLSKHYPNMADFPWIWWGGSAGHQAALDEVAPALLKTPAAVRFLSVEPLLESVKITPYVGHNAYHCKCGWHDTEHAIMGYGHDRKTQSPKQALCVKCGEEAKVYLALDWIIAGGESGKDRRDCGPDAICSVATQSVECGVPVFVKQDSALLPGTQGRIPKDIWALKQFPTP